MFSFFAGLIATAGGFIMLLYISLGLAALMLPMSFVYTKLRNSVGGRKSMVVKAFVSLMAVAIAIMMLIDTEDKTFIHYSLLAAIILSFAGDMAIGVRDKRISAGLFVFGLAHIALTAGLAKVLSGTSTAALQIYLSVFFGLFAVSTASILLLKLRTGGKIYAIFFYLACICTSTGLSYATLTLDLPYGFLLPLGVSLFFVSDMLLALLLLKKEIKPLSYVCLALYFAAIACLALSIGLCF